MLDVYQFDNFTQNYFEMFMVKDAVDKMMADENYKTILEDEFKVKFSIEEISELISVQLIVHILKEKLK
jgi:hypothetical protein